MTNKKGNVKESNKERNIIIILLISIIVILIAGMGFVAVKYEQLEHKYEDRYETPYDDDDYGTSDQLDDNDVTESQDNKTTKKTTTAKTISRDKALDIALKDMKVSKTQVYDIDVELEYKTRFQKQVYEVTFDYDRYEYEYFIDATSGKILDTLKSID